jgi:hypothetical protein
MERTVTRTKVPWRFGSEFNVLEEGFLPVRGEYCHAEKLVALSCRVIELFRHGVEH